MRDPDDPAILSLHAARAEAERHRRDLTETITTLTHRVSRGLHEVEEQVTTPLRLVRAHPFAALALGVAAGFGFARRNPRTKTHFGPAERDLEGAYLLGRRDEAEHRPARDPHYWSAAVSAQPPGPARAMLWIFAEPLLRGLAAHLGDEIHRRMSGD